MTADLGLPLRNRWSVSWRDVPLLRVEEFRDRVVTAARAGARLCLLFGVPEEGAATRLVSVLADDEGGQLGALSTRVEER